MITCCVQTCVNAKKTRKPKKGVLFHMFPRDLQCRRLWLKALAIPTVPEVHPIVCSDHFTEDDYHVTITGLRCLNATAIPIAKPTTSDASSSLRVCKVCLATDVKMHPLIDSKLHRMYEDVTGVFVCEESGFQSVCRECVTQLTAAAGFKKKAQLTDRLLSNLLREKPNLNLQDIVTLKRMYDLKSNVVIQKLIDIDRIMNPKSSIESDTAVTESDDSEDSDDETDCTGIESDESEMNATQSDETITVIQSDESGINITQDVETGFAVIQNDEPEMEIRDIYKPVLVYNETGMLLERIESFEGKYGNNVIDLRPMQDISNKSQNEIVTVGNKRTGNTPPTDVVPIQKKAAVKKPGVVKEVAVNEPGVVKEVAVKKPGVVKEVAVKKLAVVKEVAVNKPGVVKEVAVKKPGVVKEVEVKKPGVVKEVAVKKPGVVKEVAVKKPGVVKEVAVKKRAVVKDPSKINSRPIDEEKFRIKKLTHEQQLKQIQLRAESQRFKVAEHKCYQCFRTFLSQNKLTIHFLKHSEQRGAHECPVCKYRFKSAVTLGTHVDQWHGEEYHCRECPFATTNRWTAFSHMKYHEGKIYKCEQCNSEFNKSTTYLGHLRLKHMSDCVCEMCGYTFVSMRGVEAHKRLIHQLDANKVMEGPFCEICDVQFMSEAAHKRHLSLSSKHISEESINRLSNDSSKADRLVGPHSGGPRRARVPSRRKHCMSIPSEHAQLPAGPVTCEQCGTVLPNFRSYRWHFKRDHPGMNRTKYPAADTSHMCDQCGKIFMNNFLLLNHMTLHTGNTPYQCDHCNKSFRLKAILALHMQVHDVRRRKYDCHVCGKTFSFSSNRKRHLLLHTGLKPHQCNACEKCFVTLGELRLHTDHVHLKKPWPKRIRIRTKKNDVPSVKAEY